MIYGGMTRSNLKDACRNGHDFIEGSYKLSSTYKRICLICLEINRRTHCPQGHEYTTENTYSVNGAPQCKICRNQRMRDRRPATGIGAGGLNAAKTHCPKGHEYTLENTWYSKKGSRHCRICQRFNMRRQNILRYGITPEALQDCW